MIIRSRRRDRWFQRIRKALLRQGSEWSNILDERKFLHAIEKERSRADRRQLTFSIIRIRPLADNSDSVYRLAEDYRERLRITDEIGSLDAALAVLLPETSFAGASKVAEDLVGIAGDRGLAVQASISTYPENTGGPDNWHDTWGEAQHDNGRGGLHDVEKTRRPHPVESTSRCNASSAQSSSVSVASPWLLSHPTPFWKRSMDVCGAAFGLIVLWPLLAGAALLIRFSSPGPIIFAQWREGQNGRRFKIYKFRTMYQGADQDKSRILHFNELDGPAFGIRPRARLVLFQLNRANLWYPALLREERDGQNEEAGSFARLDPEREENPAYEAEGPDVVSADPPAVSHH